MALALIWLWGADPDLHPTMSPSPWAAQPQIPALPLQLQSSAWPSHVPQLAQVGTPSRSSSVTPLLPVRAGSHCSSLPGSGSHEVPLHPSTTVDQALQVLSVSCSPILLGHQGPCSDTGRFQEHPISVPELFAAAQLLLVGAALREGYWDLRGCLVIMGTLKHLPPGGSTSGFRS